MKTFTEVVKAYSTWKLQESGKYKLSKKELIVLRDNYEKELRAAKMPAQLREACSNFIDWKKLNKKEPKINKEELQGIKEALKEKNQADFKVYVDNYKKLKESTKGTAVLTEAEKAVLKKNFTESLKNGIKLEETTKDFNPISYLKEADMGMDPAAMGAPAAGDPNAMGGMPPAAPQDPMALQGAVDAALAALQPVASGGGNPLGADPNAGVPPVGGTAAPAPGLMEAAQTYLNWKAANGKGNKLDESEIATLKEKYGPKEKTEFEKIQERIAEREAKIAALQEGAVQDSQRKIDAGRGYPTPVSNSHGGDHSTSEELVQVPAASKLSNGYSSGAASGETAPAKTWPTKAVTGAGGPLQGAGASQSKIKEEEEKKAEEEKKIEEAKKIKEDEEAKEDEKEKVEEAVSVTDIYVSRSMEPKLNFEAIKESLARGLLG
jgi:hypothetical protein